MMTPGDAGVIRSTGVDRVPRDRRFAVPPRKPDEIHEREGNPSKKNLNREDGPAVDYAGPEVQRTPPSFVSKVTDAVGHWNRITPMLLRMGVFGEADVNVVGRYAVALAVLERSAELVETDGVTMKHSTGSRQISAALSAYMKAADECIKLERELGLTPCARTKVTTWGGNRPPKTPRDDAEPDAPATPTETTTPFRLTGSAS
jgi:P27 family predicted phage terminase small subunit